MDGSGSPQDAQPQPQPQPQPRLLGAGIHVAPPRRDFPLHSHGSWELVYYVSGRARCPVGEEWYDATPGTVLLTPPQTPHAEYTTGGYTNRHVQVAAPAGWPWPRVCFDDGDRSMGRVFDGLAREVAQPVVDSGELARLLLAELDILLRRAAARADLPTGERIVAEAERIVEARFASCIRISDLADELGVSPSTLRAYFAKYRRTSLRAHLHGVRLRHALGHLRNSTLTLQAIADLTGYDSVSHLSRHVKAATGTSPGRLRGRPG
ncbi:helix-turn-helix domain-containing protein [Actinopolymorpha alba]|uniref:helix-turn-helix domain-containing protein n=1 Tax=Actinopolymorpha alba TaxID=533267 RepID=UPI00035E8245|nr:AraC family transcriptional regulator [Actinopolymorpha alba]